MDQLTKILKMILTEEYSASQLIIVSLGFLFILIIGSAVYPRIAEAGALEVSYVTKWSVDYKDDEVVSKMIKTAIADDKITLHEYRNILYLVAESTEREYEKEKTANLKEIKTNLK